MLSTKTMHFNGPLGYGPGESNVIAVNAKPGSTVNLTYWTEKFKKNSACATTVPRDATILTGAPTGAANAPTQKFVFELGTLSVSRRYCFYVELIETFELSGSEKGRLDQALEAAAKKATCIGASPASPSTCGPRISANTFEKLLRDELNARDEAIEVLSKDGTKVTIVDGIGDLLTDDEEARDAISALAQAHINLEATDREIAAAIARLRKMADDGADVSVYDPLGGLQVAELRAAVQDRQLRKELDGVTLSDRETFLDLVWRLAPTLRGKFRPEKLVMEDARALQSVLDAQAASEPKPGRVVLRKADVIDIVEKLEKGTIVAKKATLETGLDVLFGKRDSLKDLAGFHSMGAHEHIADVHGSLLDIKDFVADVEANEKQVASALQAPAWVRFKDGARRLQKEKSVLREFVYTPDYRRRFSAFVTAEVGAGPLFFGRSAKPRVLVDITTFFGLNFYFQPLDINRPLDGVDFWRRFSVTGGISMTPPIREKQLRISPVVGSQMALLGAGFRVTEFLRLSAGSALYAEENANPIRDRRSIKSALYLGVSVDVNVIDTIRGWYTRAKGGK